MNCKDHYLNQVSPDRLRLFLAAAIVLLTLLLALLSASEQDRLHRAKGDATGTSIERGALLFGLHCRTCHGNRGEGVGQLGPTLADERFFTTRLAEVGWQSSLEEYVRSTIEYGRMMGTRPMYAGNGSTSVMPPWHQRHGGPLRADEVADVTAYVLNWERTATGTVGFAPLTLPETNLSDPRVIARGEKVFTAQCGRCHRSGATRETVGRGPDLSRIAVTAAERRQDMTAGEYIRESVLVPDAVVVEGYEQVGDDGECGAVLTITDLDAVSAFLLR